MTLNQLQTYIIGVLQGYFPNKAVLDKLSESADGTLLFNGQQISGETLVTDAELQQAIEDTLTQLGVTEEEITANVSTFAALQTAIANGANAITVTAPLVIAADTVLEAEEPVKIITNEVTDAFTVTDGTLTLGNNISITSDTSILYATDNGAINVEGAELHSKGVYSAGCADKNGVINVVSGKVITDTKTALSAISEGAEVNISGGMIQTKDNTFSAVYAKEGGIINVTGGELVNGGSAGGSYTLIAAKDGIVNMSGGSVDNGVLAHESADAKVTISGDAKVNGPIGTDDGASLVITGGTFNNDPTAYVADGYTVLGSNDSYSVIKNV